LFLQTPLQQAGIAFQQVDEEKGPESRHQKKKQPSLPEAEGTGHKQQRSENKQSRHRASCGSCFDAVWFSHLYRSHRVESRCTLAYEGDSLVTVQEMISVTPSMAGVVTDETQQFAAAVQGQATPAVTWSVDGGTGGNATVGTIDGQGLYTAPSQIGSYTVAANLSNLAENVKRHDRRVVGQFDFHRIICNSRNPEMIDPTAPIPRKNQIGFLPNPTHLYLAASFADLTAAGLRKIYRKPARANPTIAKSISRSFTLVALRVLSG
jgi:hypothetical protein